MAGKKDIVEQALKLVMGGAEKAAPKVVGTDAAGRPMLDFRGAVVSHFTDPESAADIWSHGYRQVGDGYYGRAVSFTPNREYGRQFGGIETNAVVSPEAKILDSGNSEHSKIIQRVLNDRSLAPTNPRPGQKTWDQKFRELGYDGLYDPGAGDLFIYNPSKVKPLPPEKSSGGRIAKGPGGWVDDIVKMAGKVISGEGEDAAKAGIRAYHGTPHDFDKFEWSPRTRGTGEGAQAYGDGLYFAGNEDVAKGYRRALSGPESMGTVTFDGRTLIDKGSPAEAWNDPSLNIIGDLHARDLTPDLLNYGSVPDAISGFRGKSKDYANRVDAIKDEKLRDITDRGAKAYSDMADFLEANPDRYGVKIPGHMYEVNINADPDSFLDWDKPLSKQPEAVRRTLEKLIGGPAGSNQVFDDMFGAVPSKGGGYEYGADGGRAYKNLDTGGGKLSEILREAGIPGIKYLDAGSRGAGDGTRNYVVFDDKLISIIRKYGIAGASAMLGYNLMEQLDPKQALAASMADQDYQSSRPQRFMGGNNSILGALNVARGLNGGK